LASENLVRNRRILVLAFGAVAAASAACANLLGFDDLRPAPPPEAGPDTGADVFVDPCPHARWPGPPDASAPGSPTEIVLAMRHVYFTTPPNDGGTADFGYDLDNRCTTDPSSASCQATSLITDDSNGRDNSSIQLMGTLSAFVTSISDTAVNDTITAGQYTIVLRLLGFRSPVNQQSTTGLQLGVQGSPGLQNDASVPQFDGKDRWLVAAEDSISPTSNIPYPTNGAYITDGTLVSVSQNPVTLRVLIPQTATPSGTLLVTLREPVLTGKLVETDAGLGMIEGIIAGRWETTDMLAAIGDLTVNNSPVCDYLNNSVFNLVKQKVCANRDINGAGADDNTAACDAVSVALRFDAVPAEVAGTPVPFPPPTTPCPHEAGTCSSDGGP
jgi:hypothetical protein